MQRVPVKVITRGVVPPGASAWVPLPRTIVFKRPEWITERLTAHELVHVTQWERHGLLFPLLYVLAWARAGFSYSNNEFEREARALENNHAYLAWACDLMKAHKE